MQAVSSLLLIIGIVFVAAGLAAIVFTLFRRVPTVALIDAKTIPVDRTAKVKEDIIAERIIRNAAKKTEPFRKLTASAWNWVRERFRAMAHKIFELERHSQHLARQQWDALTASTRMHSMVREADKLMKEDKFVEAEKKYIEALSIDQKNSKLYEKLGRLYLRNKNYDQARDTLRFASRLSSNDASVVAALGEIAMAREEYSDAITYFQHAVALRPRSPRYLDFLLEASIAGKNAGVARESLGQLSSVNPENAKLAEFEKRIRALG